ncbi:MULTISPECIES: YolD-like family protein [Bacillaceae]|uniref:YolD-like family protein n=1 Tax=Domibacillus aminovorans TaxID=29332 RepID=A0A177KVL8_9BACI|nr:MULTISPECIES: YolD-like family protein [Bacillaceae]OAH57094.1 hypothetical protein AWH48_19390 [Domibacillus aminovorans]
MLYNDRKMLKWKGMLLSEHVEMIKMDETEKPPLFLDEQAAEEFNRMVSESYHLSKPIFIEVNTFGLPYIEATGIVQSLNSHNGRLILIGKGMFCLKDIVSIRFVEEGDEYGN